MNGIRCLFALVLLAVTVDASATHFRYSHISWAPTGNAGEVVFTVKSSFRRGPPGSPEPPYTGTASDGGLAVGDRFDEYIGVTQLQFGDGASTGVLVYEVDAINTVEDWVVAHAIDPVTGQEWRHTYTGNGPYLARIASCCRTLVEVNNPSGSYEVSTIVDLGIANSSPVSTITPIVPCPEGPCIFQVPAAEVDLDDLQFRLSTALEAGDAGFTHPGAGGPDALAISPGGNVTWDSTGRPRGLYSTSVTLEESRGGPVIGKVMLDFLINTEEFLGMAPAFDVPPTPENNETYDVVGNVPLSLTLQCSDADPGDIVTLSHTGLPAGAAIAPDPAIGNPAVATFTWTPQLTQAASIGLTCVDVLGNQSLPHAFNIVVDGVVVPPGPDRDNDTFCDGLTINQLIATGLYNVIDNDLNPSATLYGTPGRDLIIAGGLGDLMFGQGGDDCIIGGVGPDYASGGEGADQIFGWNGEDVLEGDGGDDEMFGNDKDDVLLGGPGNDHLEGMDNEDLLQGGPGNDFLSGGDDIDLLAGEAGSDQLLGGFNDDVLDGGAGDDVLDGEADDDVCIVDPEDSVPPLNCPVLRPISTGPRLITTVGDLSLDEQGTLNIVITADDPNPPIPDAGGILSFSALHLPAFATLTDNGDRTANLSVDPNPGDAGEYPGIVLQVSDDGEPFQKDYEVIDLAVTGGNTAPTLSAIGSVILNENDLQTVSLIAGDPDVSNTLTFSATGLPPFATLTDNGDRTAALDIAPATGDAGQYDGIVVRVSDDGVPVLNDAEIFSIIVQGPPNNAPMITTPIDEITLEEGQVLSIPLGAEDVDGHNLSYDSLDLPVFAALADNGDGTATLDLAPIAGHAGIYVGVVVSVTDDGSPPLSDSEIFTVTVTTAVADADSDTIPDISDNCTEVPNPDQRDTNGDGFGNVCDPDLNDDGAINFSDLGLLKAVFFSADADADFDGNGSVNFSDLGVMKAMFFGAPGPSGVAP